MASEKPTETILIVDDEMSNVRILHALLRDEFATVFAISGEKALALARSPTPPDLVLLDVMMPGMSGYEVCRALKADPATADIPVIFVTGRNEVEDESQGFALGAADYIVKPFSPVIVQARVQKEMQLRRTHRALVVQAAQIEAQNVELRRALQVREDLERIARHDLRTPLASIASVPALLRAGRAVTPDEAELLDVIETSANRVLAMVNLSLDLYRMEEGRYSLRPRPVDIVASARLVLRDLAGHAASKALHLALAPEGVPVFVYGEELLCYAILANLLKNAVEAAPDGSQVRVDVTAAEPVLVRIHNEGAVPEALRERFFDKYATGGKAGGTGLGTYSAALMARAQQGVLTMQTGEATGTTLALSLPGAPAQAIPEATAMGQEAGLAPAPLRVARVLIADDDPFNALILSRYLPGAPLVVDTVINGRAALESAMRERPDVVFLDLEMPVMGGIEAMRRIRAFQAESGQAPSRFVAFSAHADPDRAEGFDFWLRKPATRDEVLAILSGTGPGAVASPECEATPDTVVCYDADLSEDLPEFLRSRREIAAELIAAAGNGDRDAVRRLAHKLAGGLALFGFVWAAAASRDIELGSGSDDMDGLRQRAERIAAHLENPVLRPLPQAGPSSAVGEEGEHAEDHSGH